MRIVFVCHGNICRSPMAEFIFKRMVKDAGLTDEFEIISRATSAEELTERILRLYPYIKNGGVTFSGGEPLLQADFFAEVAASLSERGLHIACDTSGSVPRETAERLLTHVAHR